MTKIKSTHKVSQEKEDLLDDEDDLGKTVLADLAYSATVFYKYGMKI